jgi:hypothetical protein
LIIDITAQLISPKEMMVRKSFFILFPLCHVYIWFPGKRRRGSVESDEELGVDALDSIVYDKKGSTPLSLDKNNLMLV